MISITFQLLKRHYTSLSTTSIRPNSGTSRNFRVRVTSTRSARPTSTLPRAENANSRLWSRLSSSTVLTARTTRGCYFPAMRQLFSSISVKSRCHAIGFSRSSPSLGKFLNQWSQSGRWLLTNCSHRSLKWWTSFFVQGHFFLNHKL